jgi:outer membrane receptor protein involved in Fe transport
MRTATLNGDINEESLTANVYKPTDPGDLAAESAALLGIGLAYPAGAETSANTPFPYLRCIAQVLVADEPNEKCNGLSNRTSTSQNQWGLSGQLNLQGNLGGMKNLFTGGLTWDASRVRFTQTTQFGYLNADRSVTPVNAFADGTFLDDNGNPVDSRVNLNGRTRTWSVYATDTLSLAKEWHLTASGRYNQTRVENTDQLRPGGGPGSLTGTHTFQRFNPAIGMSFTPFRAFNAHLSYSEGSRAPSSIELGCADPANPCRLPNSMAGDPPLNQVVTKTIELGAHGVLPGGTRWNAGVFRAENHDDILFVAAPANTQFGYFKNFGKTRRDGFEAGLSQRTGAFTYGANYTWLKATYRSADTLSGAGNSSNSEALAGSPGHDDGTITIRPGNRIPLIPEHNFKFFADYAVTPGWSVGGNMLAVGSSYARGNENNQHTPDGVFYLGSGKIGGYAIFNLNTRFQVDKQLSFFAQINNVLNRRYSTGGQLGPTGFTANGSFVARPFPADDDAARQSTFLAPGAPRSGWIGIRYLFDMPKPKG